MCMVDERSEMHVHGTVEECVYGIMEILWYGYNIEEATYVWYTDGMKSPCVWYSASMKPL